MPRRGSSRPAPRAPPVQSRPMSSVPAHAPPPPMAMGQPAPRQPGMMAQIATTAAGVAVGSTVGHVVGHALVGGGSNHGGGGGGGYPQQMEGQPMQVAPQPVGQQQQVYNPCQRELQNFLDCAQGQSDISLCSGFNEALRQCKLQYGVQP